MEDIFNLRLDEYGLKAGEVGDYKRDFVRIGVKCDVDGLKFGEVITPKQPTNLLSGK